MSDRIEQLEEILVGIAESLDISPGASMGRADGLLWTTPRRFGAGSPMTMAGHNCTTLKPFSSMKRSVSKEAIALVAS